MKLPFTLAGIVLLVALSVGVAISTKASAGIHKEEAHPTFVSLGDSLAFGEGASDPGTTSYSALIAAGLQPGLSERGSATREYINLGRQGGETSSTFISNGQLATAIAETVTGMNTMAKSRPRPTTSVGSEK